MKISYSYFDQMSWTKPSVFFLFFFILILNANAQIAINDYEILPHTPNSSCNTAFSPGPLVGKDAFIGNIGDTDDDPAANVNDCTTVVYEWRSCLVYDFSGVVTYNLSDQRDFDPGLITETIYFRRYTKFSCNLQSYKYKEEFSGITMRVYPLSVGGTVTPAQTICSGTSPTVQLTLNGKVGSVIKWQKSNDAAFTVPIDLIGTTTLSVATIGILTQDTWFQAVVQSGACPAENSDAVKITVNPLPVCAILGIGNVCPGSSNSFSSPPGMLSYGWSITPATSGISSASDQQSVSTVAGSGNNTSFDLSLIITDLNGCISNCSKNVTISDNQTPTFTLPSLIAGYCVEDISEAVYKDVPVNDPTDLTTLRPDYYLLAPSNTMLNISAQADNCALSANPIYWTIHFADGTPDLTGSGQLSAYVPVPPLTGIPFPVGTNTITYTLTDAAGNVSNSKSVDLIVTPRPDITKLF